MELLKFTESDIKEAAELAYPVWGIDHAKNGGRDFGLLMCEYIIRYGWFGEKYAWKIVDDGKLVGVILAGNIHQKNGYNEWLEANMPTLNESQQKEALTVKAYFGHTSPKVYKYMKADEDLYLSFFISSVKGCGKILLAGLMKQAKADGYKNIYLWTDSSCNHDYYSRNGFTLVSQFNNEDWDPEDVNYLTYIYKKIID
ncbi:MAG: hypothetical protein NC344_04700 [Bacteroidales bacterium]|nr:hypothetical protein [Bacteroidales bacterium]MCM1147125.1 hypothetical protein [Bacteroidales bacterium]MCM1205351.1 hypothetical protein [Bacillota bacterium]MCM1509844.1 hypothetical protein [Clostridium sp.]